MLGVNVWGVIHGVRLFTPMMLEAAKADPAYEGHIVNTASMAGLLAPPNMGIYNVSKHAVVSLTETLYQDLALVSDQVSASLLCPFFVPTGIGHSERNRPQSLEAQPLTASQKIGQAMTDKAVGSGKVTATDVAQKVFEAMASGQFYIYSHPQALGSVQVRMEDVVQGRNPTDPFAHKPELGRASRPRCALAESPGCQRKPCREWQGFLSPGRPRIKRRGRLGPLGGIANHRQWGARGVFYCRRAVRWAGVGAISWRAAQLLQLRFCRRAHQAQQQGIARPCPAWSAGFRC